MIKESVGIKYLGFKGSSFHVAYIKTIETDNPYDKCLVHKVLNSVRFQHVYYHFVKDFYLQYVSVLFNNISVYRRGLC